MNKLNFILFYDMIIVSIIVASSLVGSFIGKPLYNSVFSGASLLLEILTNLITEQKQNKKIIENFRDFIVVCRQLF